MDPTLNKFNPITVLTAYGSKQLLPHKLECNEKDIFISKQNILTLLIEFENHLLKNETLGSEAIERLKIYFNSLTFKEE